MEKTKKRITIIIGIVLIGIIALSYVSAYKLLCLTYGQSLPNDQIKRYTCKHDQCINICTTDNNYPTNPGYCTDMSACEFLGGSPGLDVTPPILDVNSPIEEHIYNSRSVLFDLDFDEPSSIYYIDNINGRGRWSRICSNCDGSYSKSLSFKDGLNNVTIKATDRNGNSAEVMKTFFVDSQKPRIHKVLPKGKFADGIFEVQYTEENLEKVELIYGNALTGIQTQVLPGCVSGKKVWCDIDRDLSVYDGQIIEYFFRVSDMSDSSKESKPKNLEVDTTFPVLNNPGSFWTQGVGKYDKYVYFNFSVTEKNFDESLYIDYSDTRPMWKRLCTRLDNEGLCEKKKTFRKNYHHILDIQIVDDAGNSISTERIEFDVNG